MMGTQELKNSILPPSLPPPPSLPHPPKGKKMNLVGCMFTCLISYMHIVFLDMLATIFLPLLILLIRSTPYLLGLSHTFNFVVGI